MVFSAHRFFILLLCIGSLAVHPVKITGLRSMDDALRRMKYRHGVVRNNKRMIEEFVMKESNALRWMKYHHGVVRNNKRMIEEFVMKESNAERRMKYHHGVVRNNKRKIEEFVMKESNAEKKLVIINRKIDPYQASKRTFRRGSDPSTTGHNIFAVSYNTEKSSSKFK